MPGSASAATALDAADELVVIALNVSHGFDGTAVTGAGEAAIDESGAAAIAAVGTAYSDATTAAVVRRRTKPDMKLFPQGGARFSLF